MNKNELLIWLILMLFSISPASAQGTKDIYWYNPSKESRLVVHNQLWNGNQLESFYDRLPLEVHEKTRRPVWNLSKNAAGLKLIFNTSSEEIYVRYKTGKPRSNYAMNHFPATGVSGVDLFAENLDGSWAWANGKYQFKDTISYTFTGLNLDTEGYKKGRDFHLYLPLYNSVEWLEIGVPSGNTIDFIPVSATLKPIIVYGTSIAQGGCASRPGMGWTNLLNRMLYRPVVNLGFSGNGRLEKAIVDLIAEKDAEIFVLDCLPNLSGELNNIKAKITYAVSTIRKKHPNVPIILVDQAHYIEGRLESKRSEGILKVNQVSYETYEELKAGGTDKLYYLKHEDIGLDMHDSVDGTHPTDSGMLKYANAYAKLIKAVLELD